ncbi:hypothetical protein [Methylobacterium radiodurans]|nr:hypothetical protein [Methylobacterium radiodurans]
MTGISTMWQRHAASFALGLSALTVGGLVVMLSDVALFKVMGFVLSTLPPITAATAIKNSGERADVRGIVLLRMLSKNRIVPGYNLITIALY